MLRSYAAWWILQRASPLGTTGSPRGCVSGKDVRRVEQVCVAQPAHGAGLAVRPQHPSPKDWLVQAQIGQPSDVLPLWRGQRVQVHEPLTHVDGHGELPALLILSDEPHRVPRHIHSAVDADEVDQWRSALHRHP